MATEVIATQAVASAELAPQLMLLIANAFLWGLRPGKYMARSDKSLSEATHSIKKWFAVDGDISIVRLADDQNGEYVFAIRGIKIADEAQDNANYGVILKIKKPDGKLTLGEIDFTDWHKREDFTVIVTKQRDHKSQIVDKASSTYAEVLRVLKLFPKVLADGKNLPTDSVNKLQVSNWRIIDWYRTWRGESIRQYIKSDVGHPFLFRKDFINSILIIITKNAKEAQDIINNYFAEVEYSLTCQLKNARDLHEKLTKEVKKREEEFSVKRNITAGQLILTLSISALFIGIVLLAMFNPYLLTTLVGEAVTKGIQLVVSVVTATIYGYFNSIKNFFFGTFYTIGPNSITTGLTAGVIAGAAITWSDYKRMQLEEARKKLQQAATFIQDVEHDKNNFDGEKLGAQRVLKVINSLNGNELLDLAVKQEDQDEPLGMIGTKLLGNFLSDPELGINIDLCKTLDLSGNNFGREELSELRLAIDNSRENIHFKIETIYLNGNPITEHAQEVQNIGQALKDNFTIIEIVFDDISSSQDNDIGQAVQDINRETLINRYLQGRCVEKSPNISQKLEAAGFKEFADLRSAAKEKLDKHFSAINMPNIDLQGVPQEMTHALAQNKFFVQLRNGVQESCSLADVDYGKNYVEAFKIEPQRCIKFFSAKDSLDAVCKQKIRSSLGEVSNIDLLLSLDQDIRKQLINTLFASYSKELVGDLEENIEKLIKVLDLIRITEDYLKENNKDGTDKFIAVKKDLGKTLQMLSQKSLAELAVDEKEAVKNEFIMNVNASCITLHKIMQDFAPDVLSMQQCRGEDSNLHRVAPTST